MTPALRLVAPLPRIGPMAVLNRAGNFALIALNRVGRRTLLCAAALFVVCVGLRVALLSRVPPPVPVIHDEFVYLLGADTFAHGRLANPTHPLWKFFETMHTLSHPVYASKYQPGQSLFLAFGQRVLGNPYFGVVLSVGLMVAAMYWMLRAWAPPGWALLGGMFALVSFHVNNYWMQSYWGGAVIACGAALVVGAYGRRRISWQFGLGAALILLTRPYEGGALLMLVAICVWLDRARIALPAAIVLAAVLFQAFYDWRVTGNPLRPPYIEHMRQYQVAPILWVMRPSAPKSYDYPELANLHGWEVQTYQEIMSRGLVSRIHHLMYRLNSNLPDPFRGLWMAWVVAIVFPDARLRRLAWISFGMFCALILQTWMIAHYEAPLVVVGLALMTRLGWRLWRMKPAGPALVILFGAMYMLPPIASIVRGDPTRPILPYLAGTFPQDRAAVIARLRAEGGRHVVIVRYSADHPAHREWVFNAADIDGISDRVGARPRRRQSPPPRVLRRTPLLAARARREAVPPDSSGRRDRDATVASKR